MGIRSDKGGNFPLSDGWLARLFGDPFEDSEKPAAPIDPPPPLRPGKRRADPGA
jgi:hypothetical protein